MKKLVDYLKRDFFEAEYYIRLINRQEALLSLMVGKTYEKEGHYS